MTKPFLPPRKEFEQYLKEIWDREYLTNNGPLVQELERNLKMYLEMEQLIYLTNGTIALQIAIKALGLKGEIITTPFSYVATTSSIVWEGCTPVFVDIDPKSFNINPELIEEAITERTSGILATHVFGNPCEVEEIQKIANHYQLKVIYDAAHCFGTNYKGKSIFSYGDISTTSFHATKLFHTVEGGAIFTNDEELLYRAAQMRNFGHAGFDRFDGVGINGKNSEFHAAMGLVNLKYIDEVMYRRKKQCVNYDQLLKDSPISTMGVNENAEWNCAYYPILLKDEETTLRVKSAMEEQNIYPRRYFYPSLETLEYVSKKSVIVSEEVSKRILCLPLYFDLTYSEQEFIVHAMKKGYE